MNEILTQVAGSDTAVIGGTAAIVILVVAKVAEVIGKLIPDDKTGFLGAVRKVCKFLALYVSNK